MKPLDANQAQFLNYLRPEIRERVKTRYQRIMDKEDIKESEALIRAIKEAKEESNGKAVFRF
jgi:hypothetical protein